jgi:hypothetical protein
MTMFCKIPAARRLLFFLAGFLLVLKAASDPPVLNGDIWDYLYPWQALLDHGTPDVRNEDLAALYPVLQANGYEGLGPRTLDNLPEHTGLYPTPTGRYFACHFWLYPLAALPARLALSLVGGNQLAAFQVTNVLLFLAALYLVLFHGPAAASQRFALGGLTAVSPALWYLSWPSPEVFTWSLVLASLVFLGNRRYVAAAVLAGLAAMQNPPVFFLGLFIAVCAYRERRLGLTVRTLACAALALVPAAFYEYFYGVPSTIVTHGGTDSRLISWGRTLSFLTDLNQGMLPYVPFVLVLSGVALWRALRQRHVEGLGIIGVLSLMIVAAETTTNWNSGAIGMMRYAVWMLPVFAWLIAAVLPPGRRLAVAVAAAVAIQAMIAARPHGVENYLTPTSLAHFVLTKAPALYNPEPEVFVERQLHTEETLTPAMLPIPFVTNGWHVTKLLVDRDSLSRLSEKFKVQPVYLEAVQRTHADRVGLFYLNPPRGAVVLRPVPRPEEFRRTLRLTLQDVPAPCRVPQLTVAVRVFNGGSLPLLPRAGGTYTPLRLVFRVVDGADKYLAGGFGELADPLDPGATHTIPLTVPLPRIAGEFAFEVRPLLQNVAWGDVQIRIKLRVRSEESGYVAELMLP